MRAESALREGKSVRFRISRGAALYAAAYAFPWLGVFLFLRLWVGYAPWIFGDTVSGMFGFGLAWASGFFPVLFHVPIVIPSEMAALAYLASEQVDDLKNFNDVALVLQILMLAGAAGWFGIALDRLKVSFWSALVCGAVSASMPTLGLSASAFTGYGPIGVWLGPSMTVLAFCILHRTEDSPQARQALGIVSFCAANIFSFVPTAVMAVIAIVIVSWSEFFSRTESIEAEASRRVKWISTILILAAVHSVLFGVFARLWLPWTPKEIAINFLVADIPAIAVAYLWHTRLRLVYCLRRFERRVLFPALLGWWIGCNVWAPYWFWSATHAAETRGSGKSYIDAGASLSDLASMVSIPWIWFILGGGTVAIAMLIQRWISSRTETSRIIALGALLLMPVAICFLLVRNILQAPTDVVQIPIALRYFVPLVGVTAASWSVLAADAPFGFRPIVAALTIIVGLVWFTDFAPRARAAQEELEKQARRLDVEVDSFLKNDPAGKVVCARVEMPARCGLQYGYHYTHRSERSLRWLPPPPMEGGRITFAMGCPGGGMCPQLLEAAPKGNVLFAVETGGTISDGCRQIHKEERTTLISCSVRR